MSLLFFINCKIYTNKKIEGFPTWRSEPSIVVLQPQLNYKTRMWICKDNYTSIGVNSIVVQNSYEALKVEIDNIKEDIKEIKLDNKEVKEYYRDVISELKENSIRQTEILNNQERQFARVNSDLEKVNTDISDLSNKFDNSLNENTKWYQEFLNNNFGMVFKVLVIIILLLSGVKLLGFDIEKLIGL
jgi:hypothetical protein